MEFKASCLKIDIMFNKKIGRYIKTIDNNNFGKLLQLSKKKQLESVMFSIDKENKTLINKLKEYKNIKFFTTDTLEIIIKLDL